MAQPQQTAMAKYGQAPGITQAYLRVLNQKLVDYLSREKIDELHAAARSTSKRYLPSREPTDELLAKLRDIITEERFSDFTVGEFIKGLCEPDNDEWRLGDQVWTFRALFVAAGVLREIKRDRLPLDD